MTLHGNKRIYPVPMSNKAYCGNLHHIIEAIYPHTEADVAALLSQLLVAFGNAIGRKPHYEVEATRHGTNLFALNVGISSKGRKGTSWARVKDVLKHADTNWLENQIMSGLSTGEGIIWRLADKEVVEADGSNNAMISPDKRLLCLESEFASVLKVAAREGNTLSPIVRNAWDGSKLSSLTKNSPMNVDGAHISIIGHITPSELNRYLNKTEMQNGLGNRFLYFCVKRSKLLPEGGAMSEESRNDCRDYLKSAVAFASNAGKITKTANASAMWRENYGKLSEDKWGVSGYLLGRAEAHVLRIAMTVALFNLRDKIDVCDLEAALEIWRYNEDSVRFIFGNSTGNSIADEILVELEERGELTRTGIRDLFKRNRTKAEIDEALSELNVAGHIEICKMESFGRSAELIKLKANICTTNTTEGVDQCINVVDQSFLSLMS